jgi:signal transduction histidine kinase
LGQLESALRDRSRALQEAHAAIRLREAILGMVSHDLRSPLAAIANAAALLKRSSGQEPRIAQAAEVVERSARRMNRMIRDLLDVASIDAGRLSLDRPW